MSNGRVRLPWWLHEDAMDKVGRLPEHHAARLGRVLQQAIAYRLAALEVYRELAGHKMTPAAARAIEVADTALDVAEDLRDLQSATVRWGSGRTRWGVQERLSMFQGGAASCMKPTDLMRFYIGPPQFDIEREELLVEERASVVRRYEREPEMFKFVEDRLAGRQKKLTDVSRRVFDNPNDVLLGLLQPSQVERTSVTRSTLLPLILDRLEPVLELRRAVDEATRLDRPASTAHVDQLIHVRVVDKLVRLGHTGTPARRTGAPQVRSGGPVQRWLGVDHVVPPDVEHLRRQVGLQVNLIADMAMVDASSLAGTVSRRNKPALRRGGDRADGLVLGLQAGYGICHAALQPGNAMLIRVQGAATSDITNKQIADEAKRFLQGAGLDGARLLNGLDRRAAAPSPDARPPASGRGGPSRTRRQGPPGPPSPSR